VRSGGSPALIKRAISTAITSPLRQSFVSNEEVEHDIVSCQRRLRVEMKSRGDIKTVLTTVACIQREQNEDENGTRVDSNSIHVPVRFQRTSRATHAGCEET
jgi:hypothetical protein